MDSLERTFYAVSAISALLAVVMFALFFDLGNMVLAAFHGPAALQEWAFQRNLRNARRLSVPDEVRPDETQRTIQLDLRDADRLPFETYHAPPQFSIDFKLKRERMQLVQQGFTDKEFLEMEALFRADRRHLKGMSAVDQLVLRGDALAALRELENILQRTNARNRRALLELIQLRGKLLAQLNAPPERMYDHVMQELELQLEIVNLELQGYTGIPRYRGRLEYLEARKQAVEDLRARFLTKRSEALASFGRGLAGDDFMDPATARVVKAAVQRQQQAGRLPQHEAEGIFEMVETRVDRRRSHLEQGIPLTEVHR